MPVVGGGTRGWPLQGGTEREGRVAEKKKTVKGKPKITIAEICQGLVDVYGTQRAFAEALGISESRAGKLLTVGRDNLTLFNLLKLAKLSGIDPLVVLDAAQKYEALELLRDLFGSAEGSSGPRLNQRDAHIMVTLKRMPEGVKDKLRELIDLTGT